MSAWIDLRPAERRLLLLLDGRRDRAALLATLGDGANGKQIDQLGAPE
jgi:hypothetical protein